MHADNATKTCHHCNKIKPIDEFPKYGRSTDGHSTNCRACHKIMRDAKKEAPVPFVPAPTDLQKQLRKSTGKPPKSLRKPLTPEQKAARNEAAKARRAASKAAS